VWLRENRVLRKLCGRKREKGGGGCRTLHKEELRDLYPSLCYWGDRIKEIEREEVFCMANLKERGHLEYLELNGRVGSKCINKWEVRTWTCFIFQAWN